MIRGDDAARFWSKVSRGDVDECWLWLAGKDKDGYGKFCVGPQGRQTHYRAHRYAYKLLHGSFPNGLALHSCDKPACVNPWHIEDGNQKRNREDAVSRGRVPRGERHVHAKLSDDEVKVVIQLRREGVPNKTIMKRFGVSSSYAGNVAAGRIRRGV